MSNKTTTGTKIEVRERKNGRKVDRYEIHAYPFEDTVHLDGTVIRSILLSTLCSSKLATVPVADHATPKAARTAALAEAKRLADEKGAEFSGNVD